MSATIHFPTHVTSAAAKRATKVIRVAHTPEPETENPAHNFAMMGASWAATMIVVLGVFVLLQFITR